MASLESLPLLLKQLGLPTMLKYWQEAEGQAQQHGWSHAGFLAHLAEREVNQRYQNRVARYTKESKLPPGKTLATFDFQKTPSISQPTVQSLFERTDWIAQAQNVLIFGPSGVGKTHLAAAIGHRAIEQGTRCLFTSTMALVQQLQQAKQAYQLPEKLARLRRFPLLILDDIGYVQKTEGETNVLFELIADRYEQGSLVITANQPFSEWERIFPDSTMTVAAVDRLVHHATVISIQEASFRRAQANLASSQPEKASSEP